jgi:motility quorum-sensing regulator / GCU-specific mRNA interferase toxin
MEKRKPHYDLAAVELAVRQRGADAFTATALVGAQAMGLDSASAIGVVCAMTRADFSKSMTTHAASQVWQDVYNTHYTKRQSGVYQSDVACGWFDCDSV